MTKTKHKPAMTESPLSGCDGGRSISPKEYRLRDLEEPLFTLRSYPFGELAQLYYPDRSSQGALRLFREELVQTRGLKEALEAVGYKPYCKVLTRGQVKTIVQYLGEP